MRPERTSFSGLKGWKMKIPGERPLATPAIGAGRVFIGGGYGSRTFYGFAAETGELAWKLDTDDDGPTAGVFADGKVVFNTESCTVYAVDAASGKIVWQEWLGDPLLAHPAVYRGKVFAAYPKNGKHRLACLSLDDGKQLWSAKLPHDVITAPVAAGDAIYASTYDGSVTCFGLDDGDTRWQAKTRATSAPFVSGTRLMFSRRTEVSGEPHEQIEVLDACTGEQLSQRSAAVTHNPGVSRPVWRGGEKPAKYLRSKRATVEARELDELDAKVGFASAPASAKLDQVEALVGEHRVAGSWRYQGSRPVAAGARCFSIVGDEVECFEASSGSSFWEKKKNVETGATRQLHPPALANGRLFFATSSGVLVCLDQISGRELWSCSVGHPTEWSPAVSRGSVYLGTKDGFVLAVATGNPADDGWPMWGGSAGHNGA